MAVGSTVGVRIPVAVCNAVSVAVALFVGIAVSVLVAVAIGVSVALDVAVGSARKTSPARIDSKIGSSVVALAGTALLPKTYDLPSRSILDKRTTACAPPISTAS